MELSELIWQKTDSKVRRRKQIKQKKSVLMGSSKERMGSISVRFLPHTDTEYPAEKKAGK